MRSGVAMERIPILLVGEFLLVSIQVDLHDRLKVMSLANYCYSTPLHL